MTSIPPSEKAVTQQPLRQGEPFFLNPNPDGVGIGPEFNAAYDNLKANRSGLSGTKGAPSNFETGLFDCFMDIPTCLAAWCAGPCLFNRTYKIMNRAQDRWPEDECFGGICAAFCLAHVCGCCPACLWVGLRRGAIREKYNLLGSTRKDLVLGCCCQPCAIAQEDIEVRKIELRRLTEYRNSQAHMAEQQL